MWDRPDAFQQTSLICFLKHALAVIDIVWVASSRRKPGVEGYDLLAVAVHEGTGSQLWVFHYIDQINLLRQWKLSAVASRTLSVAELVKRATAIESGLQDWLLKSRAAMSTGDEVNITTIWSAAATVYLHVVVSGPIPDVSEIRSAVDETVTGLSSLSHIQLLRRLAWPICIAASLADSRQETFFRALEMAANEDKAQTSSVRRALAVAKRCQRMREDTTGNADWFEAMDSLGEEWILY